MPGFHIAFAEKTFAFEPESSTDVGLHIVSDILDSKRIVRRGDRNASRKSRQECCWRDKECSSHAEICTGTHRQTNMPLLHPLLVSLQSPLLTHYPLNNGRERRLQLELCMVNHRPPALKILHYIFTVFAAAVREAMTPLNAAAHFIIGN